MNRAIALPIVLMLIAASVPLMCKSGSSSGPIQHVPTQDFSTSAVNEVTPSQVAWEWITQTNDDEVFLKVYIGVLYWEDNDTRVTENTLVHAYANGTLSDYGYVNAYGRISNADGHLYLGGFDASWDYVNASIWAMNLNAVGYDDLIWEQTLEVQHVLETGGTGDFTDDGAEAFIRNDIGYPNRIEVAIYDDDPVDYVKAPAGVEVSLRLRQLPSTTNTTVSRTTDADGFVYWAIDDTLAATLATGASPSVELYYSTNVTAGYTLIQRFDCLVLTTPTVTTEATVNGVYIYIVPDYVVSVVHEDFGEYSYIQGQVDTFLFSVEANTSTDTWEYSLVSNVYRLFLPDSLSESTDYNVTMRQTLQSNFIVSASSFQFTIDAPLFITERLVTIGYAEVSLSAKASAECNYTVYEDDTNMGTGTVSGDFVVYWNRAGGVGDQSFMVNFTRGVSSVTVNGSYSKASTGVLGIDLWDLEFDDAYINIMCVTTFGNTTLYIYDNDTLQATSAEADVVQYRKLSTTGVHQVGVLIDAGGSSLWKNFTYAIAIVVEAMKLTVFSWDSGSPITVSGQIQTNWSNATVTMTEGTSTKWAGTEGDSGVSFYFGKTETEGTHLVTVTVTSGASSLTYVLGYSYRPQPSGGGLPPHWDDMVGNETRDAVSAALMAYGTVMLPPAVFAGIIGFLVLFIVVVVGQVAFRVFGRKRKSTLGRIGRNVSAGMW